MSLELVLIGDVIIALVAFAGGIFVENRYSNSKVLTQVNAAVKAATNQSVPPAA